MTHHDEQEDTNNTNAPAGHPSQAEGERKDSEEARSGRETDSPAGHPSQAEGSREMIEEKLGEK